MKKQKKNKKISKQKIYALVLVCLSLITSLLIIKYDILPFKYMLLASIPLIVIPFLLIFLILKKNIKKGIKSVASVISVIMIVILLFTLFYMQKTFKFLNNLIDKGYIVKNYSVIVLKESNYDKIEQLNEKTINYYINEEEKEEVIKKLDEKITCNKEETNNYDKLVTKLYDNEADAIIMEESYINIIKENSKEFNDKTKEIYKIKIKVKINDIAKDVNVNKDTFNVYISGIDTYGDIASVSRSDVNIVATINPKTHQVLLTTIPRDYYVQLDGTEGEYKDKLTHAGIYGMEKSIKTIENLLEIDINYYVKVNFSSLEKIVDALGGVDVYSEYTFVGFEGSYFTTGYNRVNGQTALEFARTRKTVEGGDKTRGKNQQALIQAILKKSCSKEIITKYTSILSSLEGSFQTNMTTDKITDIIKKQIDEMSSWNVTSISLDGSNGSELTYSYPYQELYVMIPYEDTIVNAKEKIKQVQDGEILENSYSENDSVVNNPTKVAQQEEPQPEPKQEELKQEEKKVEQPKKEENKKIEKEEKTKEELKTEEAEKNIKDEEESSETTKEKNAETSEQKEEKEITTETEQSKKQTEE